MTSENDLVKKTKDLKVKDDSFINILLLGETGVGKSTFINSIANYLTYNDFNKAEKEKLITLIPSKFKVQDKEGEYHIITIGSEEDQNECLDTGMSATQDVKSYVFPIWNGTIKIRLIDTPGIGDVRGVDQDNINCENILSYIGQLHELHAICYLFKPTNTRLTAYFDYCVTQILSRLDKSASKNIIFVFTNTRGTDYGPGETFASLQKVISDIKARSQVDIPLSKNVFCFENESFRFLAAIKNKIEFEDTVKDRNYESWKKSVNQCNNLIKYIVGDAKNPPLKPHFIKSTSAINEARRLIVQLSQPLAEISQLINDNVTILERHKDDLNSSAHTLDELKKKLYMPIVDLEIITLTQPVTVCATQKCAAIYKVGDHNKWHYKQRCHDPCYLTNVPKEMIGSPELKNCTAIDPSTKACRKCKCDFSTHMHVYYLSKTVDGKVEDKNVKKNIDSKERILQNARDIINNMSKKRDELEEEHRTIVRTCAKFAHFLQNNAITPFSDSYKQYIEYLIIRERSLGVLSQMSVIHHLENLLQEYEEAKQSFNEALEIQKRIGETDMLITPQKIQDSIQDLYKLKHNGKKIKELYECQKKSRSKEHKYTEYVHEVLAMLGEGRAKKEKKNTQKENKDTQKDAGKKTNYQKKEFHQRDSNRKGNTQQRQRNQSQPRTSARNRSPPPAYHDSHSETHYRPPPNQQHHAGPAPYHPHPPYNQPYYPPPPNPYPGYPPPGNAGGPYAHQSYRDGPPPPPPQQSDYRHHEVPNRSGPDTSKFEVNVILTKPPSERAPPQPTPPPREQYHQGYYPPRTDYPPHYGPPHPYDNVPPPHPYEPRPYDNYHHPGTSNPMPRQNHGPHEARPYDNYHHPGTSNPMPRQDHGPPQRQRPPQNRSNNGHNDNTNRRGRGGYRGGRGQKTSAQKFKNVSNKKKNTNAESGSDSGSD